MLFIIIEFILGGFCDVFLVEEVFFLFLVSEESEMDRSDYGGIKKVCFKVVEED